MGDSNFNANLIFLKQVNILKGDAKILSIIINEDYLKVISYNYKLQALIEIATSKNLESFKVLLDNYRAVINVSDKELVVSKSALNREVGIIKALMEKFGNEFSADIKKIVLYSYIQAGQNDDANSLIKNYFKDFAENTELQEGIFFAVVEGDDVTALDNLLKCSAENFTEQKFANALMQLFAAL